MRDFFHYCDNYIDALDHAAEAFAGAQDVRHTAEATLHRLGVTVTLQDMGGLRAYDPERKVLALSHRSPPSTQIFQMLLQIALLSYDALLESTLDAARFHTLEARAIAKIGLANYFAGAALMPYGRVLTGAQECRHDLELLATKFGASIEQVAHRLSTLQRQGAKGIPFFFVRVDQAGTITKRHSATRLQFARFGGAWRNS